MTYIGIDPGKGGALAVVVTDGIATINKTPATTAEMAQLLTFAKSQYSELRCVIEAVHSMPRDGVKSAFTFGQNFGQWQGILAALGIPCMEVPPNKWMKLLGALPKEKAERKKKIQDLMQKRYGVSVTLYAADALAIATIAKDLWER
jgi:hypothetical protein